MKFKVIDTKTGKEPTSRVIDNIAKKGGLMIYDIDQFFVGEDGSLVLVDDCGKMTYCDTTRFKVVAEQKTSHWIDCGSYYKCPECDNWVDEVDGMPKFCDECGMKMVDEGNKNEQ